MKKKNSLKNTRKKEKLFSSEACFFKFEKKCFRLLSPTDTTTIYLFKNFSLSLSLSLSLFSHTRTRTHADTHTHIHTGISLFSRKSQVFRYFSNVMHNSAAPGTFARAMKVTSHTKLWDDTLRMLLTGFASMAWIPVLKSTIFGLPGPTF